MVCQSIGWSVTCDTIYSPDFWSPGLTQTLPCTPQDTSLTSAAKCTFVNEPGQLSSMAQGDSVSCARSHVTSRSFDEPPETILHCQVPSFDIVEELSDDEVIDLPFGSVDSVAVEGGCQEANRDAAVTGTDGSSPTQVGPEVLDVPSVSVGVVVSPSAPTPHSTQGSGAASNSIDRLAEVVAGLAATVGSLAEIQATSTVVQKLEDASIKNRSTHEALSQEVIPLEDLEKEVIEQSAALTSCGTARIEWPDNVESCSEASTGIEAARPIRDKVPRIQPVACTDATRAPRRHSDVVVNVQSKRKQKPKRPHSLGPQFFNLCEDDTDSSRELESFRNSPISSQSPSESPERCSESPRGVANGSASEFGRWLCQQQPRFRFNQAAGLAWEFPLDQSEKRDLLIAHMAIGEHEAQKEAQRTSEEYDSIVRRVSLGPLSASVCKQRPFSRVRRSLGRLSAPSRKTRRVSAPRSKRKSLGSELETAVVCD